MSYSEPQTRPAEELPEAIKSYFNSQTSIRQPVEYATEPEPELKPIEEQTVLRGIPISQRLKRERFQKRMKKERRFQKHLEKALKRK